MITAQSAHKAYLAIIILTGAALVFPKNTWAASGNTQICRPNTTCEIGEFLYDDSYTPITTATCTITSRKPDGSVFINNASMDSASDGWYSYQFSAPTTEGLYRTQVCCTPPGENQLCLDKTFEVKTESTLSSADVASAVWGTSRSAYSGSGTFGEAIQTIIPTSSDIASATWNYSTRTLSSFGNLVSDIWDNATRTLTGAGLSSGSLATKSDVESARDDIETKISDTDVSGTTVTNITNISNVTNQIQNSLEQIINKPIIDTTIESYTPTFELESKLDETREFRDKIIIKTDYIKGKIALIDTKWSLYPPGQIEKILEDVSSVIGKEKDDYSQSSLFGHTYWLIDKWNWQEADRLLVRVKKLRYELSLISASLVQNGKTTHAHKKLKYLLTQVGQIKNLVNGKSKKTISAKINEIEKLAGKFNSKSAQLDNILSSWDNKNSNKTVKEVSSLSREIALLNRLPRTRKLILSGVRNPTEKDLKNKILSLRGIIAANVKSLAQKSGEPISATWLELGSIVFKTLITNPSSRISQTVPLKYYLPVEIKRENIVKMDDGLSLHFDAEKNQYYVKGEFVLPPGGTKTIKLTVDDNVFTHSEDEINSLKKQADDLSQPLKNTSYFAQGVTLKSDIDVSLEKVLALQKSATTPEEKIRAYREGEIELAAAREKLDRLKELATQAGSVGTLLGFVGGAQALAVWGLIIVMAAGFVFLTLYMRTLTQNNFAVAKGGKIVQKPLEAEVQKSENNRLRLEKFIRIAAIILAFGLLAGLIIILVLRRTNLSSASPVNNSIRGEQSLATASKSISKDETKDGTPPAKSAEKVTIFVPEGSKVSIHQEPSIESPVLATLSYAQKTLLLEEGSHWSKIKTETEDKQIEGWVSSDFIERSAPDLADENNMLAAQLIQIKDTPVGFLRVREKPWGREITKVLPGEEFPLLEQGDSWSKISLEDKTVGWVYNQYIEEVLAHNSAMGDALGSQ